MSSDDDPLKRDRWARLRFAIIGPLLAAPPAPGDLQGRLSELAARTWRHPLTGLEVRFGASTIERWYYAARGATDPMAVLRNQIRSDIGLFPSVATEAAEALRAQYAEHPGWTAQLHHDNLRVVLAAASPPVTCPSYPSVRRYLKAQGLTRKRPVRRGADEILRGNAVMSERGSAMMSGEFTAGLTALGILHVPTLPRSPHVYVPE